MFETLDAIDWASLRGCYRWAADMPEHLRAFLSPVAEIRDRAIYEIGSAIFHQGTVYDVTPVVMPFLFELLENDDVQDKEEVVCLLASLAACCLPEEETDERTRRSIDAALRQKFGMPYEESVRRHRESVHAVKAGLAQRFDLLYPYLRYPDDFYVRLSVASALCDLPGIAKRVRPDLEQALQSETDEDVRATIEAALAME